MPKLLSHDETRTLVDSYVKTFSQRMAAKKLTERGYRSPEGKPISQGHIFRILNGSETCFQSPPEPQETKADSPQVTETPKEEPPLLVVKEEEPAPWNPRPLIDQTVADDFAALTEEEKQRIADAKAFAELRREELLTEIAEEAEEEDQEPRQSTKYLQKVPEPSDYTRREHPKPAQHARLHAVFNRRGPVEFETDEAGEEKLYYGIPKLRKPQPLTTRRPHEKHSFGQNSISTR